MLTMLLSSFGFLNAAVAPPNIVTYQGRVLNANGVPVADASLSIKFALYTALSGGTCLWSNDSADCYTNTPASIVARSVTLSSGLFTENLGDTGASYAAIADSVFADNASVYLEVIIAGETLTPRRRFTASPYALNAQRLDGIDSTGFLASNGDTGTGDYDFSGAELVGASPLVFEGGTNNSVTTTFAFTDPTLNRTITFQNASGTVAYSADITNAAHWETGTNGSFEDDAATIIGIDAAFTYGSGGVGDLRIADELEVLGDAFIDNDLVIGASTSATETLAHTSFSLGGDDLFVAGTLGVEGAIYTDGGFFAGADTTFGSGLITTTGTTDLLLTIAGGDLAFAQATVIGDGGDVLSIDSSDWDISTTGDLTGIGAITMGGLFDANGNVSIADTDIAFDGASTTFTSTGVFTLTPGGSVLLGDGGDTMQINSSDWDISTTGDLTGIGAITMDGDLLVGGDNIDSVGAHLVLNATAADEVRIGTGTPVVATGAGDLYVTSDLEVDAVLDVAGIANLSGGISLKGALLDLDSDGDTSLIASTDDQIDWEIGGIAQTIIMRDPLLADDASSVINPILEINYATPADTTGTNIHTGLQIDLDIGNATGGTNRISAITTDAMIGDAEVSELHALRIEALTGSASTNETAINIADGWDAGIYIEGASPNFWIGNGARLAFQDNGGNDIFILQDLSNANNHSISIDNNTALMFDSTADTDIDITTLNNQRLFIQPAGSGDVRFGADADTGVEIVASAPANMDLLSITNSGQATTTSGADGIDLTFLATNASSSALSLSLGYTGGATDGRNYTGIALGAFTATNAAGIDTVNGIDIGPITDPGVTIQSYGLRLAAGWDSQLFFDDTSSNISLQDAGTLKFSDSAGNTLMELADSGTSGTLAIETITNTTTAVNLFDNTVTKTIDLGGVTSDANDTIRIATEGTTADNISIGNANASTVFALTGGNDWLITSSGVAFFTFGTAGGYDKALCSDGVGYSDIQDCTGAPIADYAEQYPMATGIDYGDIVVPGSREVTTIDGDTIVELVKSTEIYQGPVVGIVSNNYGDFTSAGYNINESDNPMPVALVGRVPVKVVSEGGSISVGDYLTTSSTPGKAMRASKVGRVIGMALEDWNGVSSTVMVQVNNSWSMGDVLGTDGTSTLVTDNVIVSSVGTATVSETTFDSYGLALRGSAWNGSEASAVELMLRNVVDNEDSYRLSIQNTAESEVAYITNEGTMKIAGDMIVGGRIYPSDRGTPQTDKYIYYDGSAGAAGDFMRTNAKGWSTGSYDFAEMFPSNQKLTAGDIVTFAGSGEAVQRAVGEAGKQQLAGIVSTRPGFLAGENVEGAYPIALAGRVPTKVNTENGSIAVGDPLTTSSVPGVAMKAEKAGQVVGYALETYSSKDTDNLILAYVSVGYWSGLPTDAVPIVQNTASVIQVSGSNNFSALNMSGNIYMATHQILSIGRLEGISSLWSIEADGTIKTEALLKTVINSYQNKKVETIAVTSPEVLITLTGTATLVNGSAEVRFESVVPEYNDVISAVAPIRVIVTPNGPASLYVSERDQNHFVVQRFAGSADVEFDWIVTAYRKGYEPAEEVAEEIVIESMEEVVIDQIEEEVSEDSVLEEEPIAGEILIEEPAVIVDVPATPESPDETLIDSQTQSDVGAIAEEPPTS
ncbi:hypothetical protein HQ487_03395 [Candidatus Uhrbacteria bacterium]|nr:hypothetical protein [Candidatus Uhrbacteria bacterium]